MTEHRPESHLSTIVDLGETRLLRGGASSGHSRMTVRSKKMGLHE